MPDRVLFVADQLENADRAPGVHHPGGAELSDAAAVRACPWAIDVSTFADLVTPRLARYDAIVVGNAERASRAQLRAIARTGRHVSFEHDVRICRWRGNFPASRDPTHAIRQRCFCPHDQLTELYRRARGVIFLTLRQQRVFLDNPFFETTNQAVIGSSLFETSTLERLERLGGSQSDREGALYLWAPDRIKGTAIAREYCSSHGLRADEIRNVSPDRVLEMMSRARRFVYLPLGLEPAGRMPVEARLAGCDVVVNANVGVCGEAWWSANRTAALSQLERAPRQLWQHIERWLNETSVARASRQRRMARAMSRSWLALAEAAGHITPRLPTAPRSSSRAREAEQFVRW